MLIINQQFWVYKFYFAEKKEGEEESEKKDEDESTETKEKTEENGDSEKMDESNEKSKTEDDQDKKEEENDDVEMDKTPKPRALHKTTSIFLRNLAPTITKQEVEAMCKRYNGFLR